MSGTRGGCRRGGTRAARLPGSAGGTSAAPTALQALAEESAAERVLVKWATPADEALGTAKLAGALVDRRIARPSEIAVAVPNRVWATNLLRACESCDVKASLCISQDTVANEVAALDDGKFDDLGLKGLSLVRHLGWDARPEFVHALQHVSGDEGPRELAALVREQLTRPTVPEHATRIPIMLVSELTAADYLYIVGCVDGLFPFEGDGGQRAFADTIAAGRARTTASYFAKAPLALAEAARIRIVRRKTEDGQELAMTRPIPYLTEAGTWRPTTTGGQALLRTYGLN